MNEKKLPCKDDLKKIIEHKKIRAKVPEIMQELALFNHEQEQYVQERKLYDKFNETAIRQMQKLPNFIENIPVSKFLPSYGFEMTDVSCPVLHEFVEKFKKNIDTDIDLYVTNNIHRGYYTYNEQKSKFYHMPNPKQGCFIQFCYDM